MLLRAATLAAPCPRVQKRAYPDENVTTPALANRFALVILWGFLRRAASVEAIKNLLVGVLETSVMVLALGILLGVIAIAILYVIDVTQSDQAIRRNYPVIGRLRYFFEHLGVFFRQYFFAMDREELPFNRAQRQWVARASKNIDSTLAFGSTKPLSEPGQILFLNSMFPKLEQEAEIAEREPVVYGEGYAREPFITFSFFNISAMSYGALSAPAIKALSRGAAKAGIWLNTGEGALSPFHLEGTCDLIFQIGTAKYGVRDATGKLSDDKLREVASNSRVRMFEIKLSQGAKPGKGGMLPGAKVTEIIAKTRGIAVGEDSISPNRHEDITSVGDLLDMINRVREVTGKPTGIKFVLGQSTWLDEFCQEIHRRGVAAAPDFITLDSADGGTGAAPQSLLDNMGLPLRSSLPTLVDKLNEYGLRERIRSSRRARRSHLPGWRQRCASEPTPSILPGVLCSPWVVSRPCSATRIPAPRGLPPTTNTCRRASTPWSRPTGSPPTRAT